MNITSRTIGILTLLSILVSVSSCTRTPPSIFRKVELKAIPFEISDVRILDGPFKTAQKANNEYLLSLDADRFLHRWRLNAGLEPKGEIYGGWEATSSHMLGHYISGLSYAFAATGNPEFKRRVDYIVDELDLIQETRGTGYVGGIPNEDTIWNEVLSGNIRSGGFDLNGGWVPWYMLHKTWQGLLDAYTLTGNSKAKKVVIGMSDWVCNNFTTERLSDEQFQMMLMAEFGGMNDVLAQVYQITGDKKYLDMAYRFEHRLFIDPLEDKEDKLAGMHANTQIPKIIGNATEYEATGNSREREIVEFFWDRVVNHHSYIIGGNSLNELFTEADDIAGNIDGNTAETCNTYNMLKLTKKLYTWDPQIKYADYYEKALFNHILASINPETGMTTYFMHLGSGKQKVYCSHEDFWCCTGTGLENPGKYSEAIYFKDQSGGLFVNLFVASELNWKENGMIIRQSTKWPFEDTTTLTVEKGSKTFPLHVRYPGWATKEIKISVNDSDITVSQRSGSYITVERKWEKGDVVKIKVPMELSLVGTPDTSNKYNILYGPIVLAALLGKDPLLPVISTPVLITGGRDVKEWVKPVDESKLIFKTVGVAIPHDVTLAPFFSITDQTQIVYFDLFSMAEWEAKRPAFEKGIAEAEALKAITTDFIATGEQQPEKDHDLKFENSNVGERAGRRFRKAGDGGWFSFEAKVNVEAAHQLTCTYSGSDGEDRQFEIFVDDKVIAAEKLHEEAPGEFIDRIYDIPQELTKGKTKVTIKFRALPGYTVGGVFGCRITISTISQSSHKALCR